MQRHEEIRGNPVFTLGVTADGARRGEVKRLKKSYKWICRHFDEDSNSLVERISSDQNQLKSFVTSRKILSPIKREGLALMASWLTFVFTLLDLSMFRLTVPSGLRTLVMLTLEEE